MGFVLLPDRTEPVTREALAAARARWQGARIANYDLDLETRGAQVGNYHVEVRDHQVRSIIRDGTPATPNDLDYWTVDGLFVTIEEELDRAESRRGGPSDPVMDVWLRMRCHPKLGYPVRFVSHVPMRTQSVEIHVLRLEPQ
jgi:hypothetical protein